MKEIASRRWNVALAAAIVAVGLGIVLRNTTVFLAAGIGVVYAAYGYAIGPPSPTITVDRSVSETRPAPGEEVSVQLTVTNDGDVPLPDVRVFDAPPEGPRVVDGSPALVTSLESGETRTVSYTLHVGRGHHEFDPVVVVCRNVNARIERRFEVEAPTEIEVVTDLDRLPLTGQTVPYTGRVPTDEGGDGIEFYSVREYRRQDPMNRVDWNRYARTRRMRTIEFREHHAASVVVIVDTRAEAALARRAGEPDGVELGKIATDHVMDTLLDENNLVGLALVGNEEGYLRPGAGSNQLHRARRLLDNRSETVRDSKKLLPGKSFGYGSVRSRIDTLERYLPEDSQVVFVSPVLDDEPVAAATELKAHGHAVTTLSPDVTTSESLGGTVERIERSRRLSRLREIGTRVIDWGVDEPLPAAVRRGKRGWS